MLGFSEILYYYYYYYYYYCCFCYYYHYYNYYCYCYYYYYYYYVLLVSFRKHAWRKCKYFISRGKWHNIQLFGMDFSADGTTSRCTAKCLQRIDDGSWKRWCSPVRGKAQDTLHFCRYDGIAKILKHCSSQYYTMVSLGGKKYIQKTVNKKYTVKGAEELVLNNCKWKLCV